MYIYYIYLREHKNSDKQNVKMIKSLKYSINKGAQREHFPGGGGFVELWHLDKHFIKNTRKKVPQDSEVFSPRYS